MSSSDWAAWYIFLFLHLSVEQAPWQTRQVPHPLPLPCGHLVLYQHRVSSQLPSVAGGKEQDNYRFVKTSSIPSLWFNFGIKLWTGFPDSFAMDFQKRLVLLFSQTVAIKAGFLWAAAGTWPRCLEIEQSTGCSRFSQGELTVNQMQTFTTIYTLYRYSLGLCSCLCLHDAVRSVFVREHSLV